MGCKNESCDPNTCSADNCESKKTPVLESGLPHAVPAGSETVGDAMAAIKKHAANFSELYASYNALRTLAKPLNGLQQSDTFPDGVKIKSVSIAYEVNGVSGEAVIPGVTFIGELAPLIAPALRNFIDDIRNELNMLDGVTTAMKTALNVYAPAVVPTLSRPELNDS